MASVASVANVASGVASVASMPLVATDVGSWIDVTLLRRRDGRARG